MPFEFDRRCFEVNEKNNLYFTCPKAAEIVLKTRTVIYSDLKSFQSVIGRANLEMGDEPSLYVVAKESTQYIKVVCKFKGCLY